MLPKFLGNPGICHSVFNTFIHVHTSLEDVGRTAAFMPAFNGINIWNENDTSHMHSSKNVYCQKIKLYVHFDNM